MRERDHHQVNRVDGIRRARHGTSEVLLRVAIAAALTAGLTLSPATTDPASAAALASFDPVASSSFGAASVFPQVVASGDGTYHAVARTDGGIQAISYRRSVDGGVTWVTAGRFAGEAGGATRPSIAVSGQRVAVAFIGAWCPPAPNPCEQAPYLATSTDGGLRWTGPVRLDGRAFDVAVAVDGDRTWVTWGRGSTVELRGTDDGASSFFVQTSLPGFSPTVAAAGGRAVFAWAARGDMTRVRSAVATARTLAPAQDVGPETARLGGTSAVAAAAGRVHLLLRDADRLLVASGAGPLAAPIDVGEAGYSASIAARRGLVAVARGDADGVTWVSASADGGASFSAAVPVSTTPGGEPLVEVGVAALTTDRPIARFSWSVPDRYVPGSSGRRAPANATGDATTDATTIGRDAMTVHLDACRSLAPVGRRIAEYRWTVDGVPRPEDACRIDLETTDGARSRVRLEVVDDAGATGSVGQDVQPEDFLVVSIGDSIASGEGNPDVPAQYRPVLPIFETWQDDPCHRSTSAGPARAAARLEDADPHSSVTFVHLACSGASIIDVPATAGASPSGPDDPDTGGVLDAYHGIAPGGRPARPSQVAQLRSLVGSRPVDALLVSVGANDIKFSEVVEECIASRVADPRPCHRSGTASRVATRLGTLPARYGRLADALADPVAGVGIAPERVHITEYFDPTTDELGVENLRCIANSEAIGVFSGVVRDLSSAALVVVAEAREPLFEAIEFLAAVIAESTDGGVVTDDETAWARHTVVGGLNSAVASAAAEHGWNFVGGVADRFDRHGYCADDPWVVTIGDSLLGQIDIDGPVHPNADGHEVYGRAIFGSLRSRLLAPAPADAGVPAGRDATGDIYVTTATRTTVSAAVVRDTGSAPVLVRGRRLDRLTLGNGYLGPGGRPAADAASAVAAWTQVDADGPPRPTARVGQIVLAENATVQRVSIVQAPADGTGIVADRRSLVLASIDAALTDPQTVDVTTEVYATGDTGTRTVVGPITQPVRLVPGRNDVLLPTDSTFAAAAGERLGANVTVTDPLGADPGDDVDNSGSTQDREPIAATTRPMGLVFMSAAVPGSAAVSCAGVGRAARRMTEYASAAMPVVDDGVVTGLACSELTVVEQSERGVLEALADLDHLGRLTALDAVVAVVPDGWLQQAADGAVGAAAAGMRAVVVEASAPSEVLAHELSHTLGLGHLNGRPAFGANTADRRVVAGVDWMNEKTVDKVWTGGATWDTLIDRIGPPSAAPKLPDPASPGVWVRGQVSRTADGKWVVSRAQWTPAAADERYDSDLEDLQLDRMRLDQLDAAGGVVASQAIGLATAGGLYGAGVAEAPDPIGLTFASLVELDPATTQLVLVLDDVAVDTRPVNAAPSIAVTAPTAGTAVARGEELVVGWTATDPDGDTLTVDLLVSDDDGASWEPLASGIADASSHPVRVPADLDGPAVRIRAVVTDGVRSAWADSDAFTVDAGAGGAVSERVVFSRVTLDYPTLTFFSELYTMAPDGTDVRRVPLPEADTYVDDTTACYGWCGVLYFEPTWAPDGRILFTSDLADPRYQTPEEQDHPYNMGVNLYSVAPDGSDLRRISVLDQAGQALTSAACPDVSPDGTMVAWRSRTGITVSRIDGSEARLVHPDLLVDNRLSFPDTWPAVVDTDPSATYDDLRLSLIGDTFDSTISVGSCPVWSPDGSRLAMAATVQYDYLEPSVGQVVRLNVGHVVLVMGADGSDPAVVSPPPASAIRSSFGNHFYEQTEDLSQPEWAPDGTLVVGRYEIRPREVPRYGAFRLDPATATLQRLTADRTPNDAPSSFGVSPDGEVLYGTVQLVRSCPPSCFIDTDFVTIDLDGDVVTRIPQPAAETYDVDFDWALVPDGTSTGDPVVDLPDAEPTVPASAGGPYSVVADEPVVLDAGASGSLGGPDGATAEITWDLDGDGEFDDAVGVRPTVSFPAAGTVPVRVRIATGGTTRTSEPVDVVVRARPPIDVVPPAPGADAPLPPLVGPADTAITVPSGATTPVRLTPPGSDASVVVVAGPDPAALLVESPLPPTGPDAPASGPGGVLLLTPADGFVGTTSLTVAAVGSTGGAATIAVTVTGNRPPITVQDSLTVRAGVPTVFDAADLTANDTDPDPGDEDLSVVSVGGSTNGLAWLDGDGRVHVVADAPGSGRATYLAADPAGGITAGSLALTVLPAVDPPVPPGVPVGLRATPGDRRVTLSWSPPADTGGATVTGWVVQHREAGRSAWTERTVGATAPAARAAAAGATVTADVTGLRNGVRYELRVAATSGAGTGAFTAVVAASPVAAPATTTTPTTTTPTTPTTTATTTPTTAATTLPPTTRPGTSPPTTGRPGGRLPATGSGTTRALQLALALLVLGGALVLATRRSPRSAPGHPAQRADQAASSRRST